MVRRLASLSRLQVISTCRGPKFLQCAKHKPEYLFGMALSALAWPDRITDLTAILRHAACNFMTYLNHAHQLVVRHRHPLRALRPSPGNRISV